MKGHDKNTWNQSNANGIGRLIQGTQTNPSITGTNTSFFTQHTAVPIDWCRDVTYLRMICGYKPHKAEKHHIRWTVGGNLINYPRKVSMLTANLEIVKLHFNPVVSTPNAQLGTTNLKNFYLGTPMDRYEYMKAHIKNIPPQIMLQENHLHALVRNEHLLIKIRYGMYGLPQAGILANNQLVAWEILVVSLVLLQKSCPSPAQVWLSKIKNPQSPLVQTHVGWSPSPQESEREIVVGIQPNRVLKI
jgi:hypothetical protein